MQYIAGVDEAGRGPLAGPVVAAAVILDPSNPIDGLNDSKLLSEKKREVLFTEIQAKALAYCVSEASVAEIDSINILQASLLAMQRSVKGLKIQPDLALIDGNRCPDLPCKAEAIIKGDQKEQCIGAASILAKVTRDRLMLEYAKEFPEYGFAKHKGYPTLEHRTAIQKYGVTKIHRTSYAPVKKILMANLVATE